MRYPIAAAVVTGLLSVTACQSVDLSQKSGPPTCAVSAADYKLLRYWNARTEDKKYARIIGLLEKKYAAAPLVDGRSAVVAAQSYVRTNANMDPLRIQSTVEAACQQIRRR